MRAVTRRLITILASLALVVSLAACGASSGATDGDDTSGGDGGEDSVAEADEADEEGRESDWAGLTFTIGDQRDGIRTLSEISGAFDDAPYDIDFAQFEFGPPLVAAAASGDIDLGMVGNVPPLAGAAAGQEIKIIAEQVPLDPDYPTNSIIVPEGSELETIEDLVGARIAIPQGSSAHGLALNTLKSAGLTTDDVEFVYLPPSEGASAFSAGRVDAWAIWEPLAGLAVNQGARVLVPGLPPIYHGNLFYVGSQQSLDDPVRREALADVLERVARAYAYGNANPEEHIDAVQRDTGLPRDEVVEALESWRRTFRFVTPEVIEAYQELADNFYEAGEFDVEIDVEDLIDNLLPEGFVLG